MGEEPSIRTLDDHRRRERWKWPEVPSGEPPPCPKWHQTSSSSSCQRRRSIITTQNSQGTFSIPFFHLILMLLTFLPAVPAIKNEFLTISKLCQDSRSGFLSSLPRPVDGAVVTSKNERDVDCVVTFQTESILERFMLRFEQLAVDCNDRLIVYDGAHAIGNSKANLSCDTTASTFGTDGVVYTRTNFVTLKYRTDSWGTDEHGFKLIITAFKGAEKKGCRDGFLCDRGICIDNDLVCDNVDHCGDGADERHSQFCSPVGLPAWVLSADTTTSVSVALAAFLLVAATSIACWIVSWKKRNAREMQHQQQLAAGANAFQMRSKMNGSLFTSSQMQAAATAAQQVPGSAARTTTLGDGEGMRSGGGSLGSLGMGNLNLESQMYTSTSLMATGNTHHIFDSTPPIQDDPFQQSSAALTAMIDNQGNAKHPAGPRGSTQIRKDKVHATSSGLPAEALTVLGMGIARRRCLPTCTTVPMW